MQLDENYQPQDVESRWYDFWQQKGFFKAEVSDKKPFTIVIPPPNVTGRLHMGHAIFVTLQDMMIRWKRMAGFEALWLPGTDHAGIATQVMVERELKKEGKTRHDLGREAFLERVWAYTKINGGTIIDQMKRLGASCDWDRLKFTMDDDLVDAVKEAFVRLYGQGLIYRAERMIDWDPVMQTVVSDLEVDREEEMGRFWYLKYPLADGSGEIIVGTTRPETMLGDTAVAVHPDDPRYKDMIGKMIALPIVNREIPIIADDILPDPEKGTGAVKVTPAHDPNDFECGERHQLPRIQVIGFDGCINDQAPADYQGLPREEARKKVIEDFKSLGLFEREEDRMYSPGRSQRSGAIVEPLPMLQWFVDTAPLAKRAIDAVESGETEIIPGNHKKTFDHFMHNIRPWCISRQLWWGHRIPAYYCDDENCDHITVSREEETTCVCGATLHQDQDVLDTWFSSALWPFSTLGWPQENDDLDYFYPTSVLETGSDILFFWVARMMMMGCWFLDQSPFEQVYLHAMVRDSKGEKMSKTKGNVIDPMHMIEGAQPSALDPELHQELLNQYPEGVDAQGSDALRFTLAIYAAQGRDIKLDVSRIAGYRAFLNKLWNASKFALMNLEDYQPSTWNDISTKARQEGTLADKWILARYAEVVEEVCEALEQYQFSDYAQKLYHFVWHEFCDWYIEMAKLTLFNKDDEEARANTQETLLYVLDGILRLMHPVTPFITEDIWQALPKPKGAEVEVPESIMVAPFPTIVDVFKLKSEEDLAAGVAVQDLISAVRNIRGETKIKPGVTIPTLFLSTNEVGRKRLVAGEPAILKLAKIDWIAIIDQDELEAKEGCASAVVGDYKLRIPLKGMIALDEEIARLKKQIEKAEATIAHASKKLNNPRFVDNAPEDVVNQEKERVAQGEEEKKILTAALQELEQMAAQEDEE